MTITLFRVSSLVPEFKNHKGVALNWFVSKRTTPLALSYETLIENYDAAEHYIHYPKGALDEMFTEAEAAALAGYLKQYYGDNPEIAAVALPIPSNIMGNGATPVGGPQDFLIISNNEDYRLPFEVMGYFDLRHATAGPYADDVRAQEIPW